MILSGQTIKKLEIIRPTLERTREFGMTYGLGPSGYDVRVDFGENVNSVHYGINTDDFWCPVYIPWLILEPGEFSLAATMEKFSMPRNVVGIVHDKSTWARKGLAVQNTVIEPGWRGYLTLELTNHSKTTLKIERGMPIAQIIFHFTDEETVGYEGKYQDQEKGPQAARHDP